MLFPAKSKYRENVDFPTLPLIQSNLLIQGEAELLSCSLRRTDKSGWIPCLTSSMPLASLEKSCTTAQKNEKVVGPLVKGFQGFNCRSGDGGRDAGFNFISHMSTLGISQTALTDLSAWVGQP